MGPLLLVFSDQRRIGALGSIIVSYRKRDKIGLGLTSVNHLNYPELADANCQSLLLVPSEP